LSYAVAQVPSTADYGKIETRPSVSIQEFTDQHVLLDNVIYSL